MRAIRIVSALLFLLGVSAIVFSARPPEPAFDVPAKQQASVIGPAFTEHVLPQPTPSAHSVSLVDLGNGKIGAAWFGGRREGADDVGVWFSIFSNNQWAQASEIVNRANTQAEVARFVRKIGNPVLWRAPDGPLHLFFVSVSYGGWAGSSINHKISLDGGMSWQAANRLVTSPFLNISTLVRGAPLTLSDGSVVLPVYHEFISKFPEWLHLASDGTVITKRRMDHGRNTLQPSVAALDAHHALAVLRYGGPAPARIWATETRDGGLGWEPAHALSLPNPNAGIALARLSDGRLLLAYNPVEGNRNRLGLAVSADGGATWKASRMLEDSADAANEYSYPSVLQSADGYIHVAYTYHRKSIKHVVFTPEWLDGEAM